MKIKELKKILNSYPEEYDEGDIAVKFEGRHNIDDVYFDRHEYDEIPSLVFDIDINNKHIKNEVKELTREEIEEKYPGKPILIKYQDGEPEWFIVKDVYSTLPPYKLTEEDIDRLHPNADNDDKEDEDEAFDAIELINDYESSYAIWIYFNEPYGWKAYGYE